MNQLIKDSVFGKSSMALQMIKEVSALGFNWLRFITFNWQHISLNYALRNLAFWNKGLTVPPLPPVQKKLFTELKALIREDAKNIGDGIYPVSVLRTEHLLKHLGRLPRLFLDSALVYKRRRSRTAKAFSTRATDYLDEVPEYYRRNYHFQTDGYLSEASALLYDHQVELLFSGTADAMRRSFIRPLKNMLGQNMKTQFLELGCGTGRTTKFVRLAFKNANIVASDVSHPYLRIAGKNLRNLKGIDYIQSPAENLPFKDQSFDVVYSTFLFHEIPENIRREVLAESYRLLKKGGIVVIVDSLQSHDKVELNSILEQFPKDFHEPFYKSYIDQPMEELLTSTGFGFVKTNFHFLVKCLVAQKI